MRGFPKYTYGDIVKFRCSGEKTGVIAIIDKYGTFEDSSDVSYDILDKEQKVLYKHIREDFVIEKIGNSPEDKIW